MTLLLLMYESVTGATMKLLNCVSVGGTQHLFRAGYVMCYTRWQYPLFVILSIFLIPFPGLLFIVRRSFKLQAQNNNRAAHAILEVLEGPYRSQRRWWESMLMFRRLVVLVLFTFIPYPIWRALSLFVGCFLVLLTHVYFQPYESERAQRVETAFLINLTLIAAFQIPEGVYSYLGQVYNMQSLQWVEVVLIVLPFGYCVGVLIFDKGPALGRNTKEHARILWNKMVNTAHNLWQLFALKVAVCFLFMKHTMFAPSQMQPEVK